jgi:hypothetical protein
MEKILEKLFGRDLAPVICEYCRNKINLSNILHATQYLRDDRSGTRSIKIANFDRPSLFKHDFQICSRIWTSIYNCSNQ